MVSARSILALTALVLLPILLMLVVVLAFDANLFVMMLLMTWLGLGVVFGSVGMVDG